MGWELPDIEWPSIDWEAWVKPKLIELLNRFGYPWPTTSPEALRDSAGEWSGLQLTLRSHLSELDVGLRRLETGNEGVAVEVAANSLRRDDSGHATLSGLADAMGPIAGSYRLAADVVVALRVAVVAELLLDAIQLGMAIWSGGMSAGVSMLVKQGAGAAIDYLIDQAISSLLGA